LGESTGGRPPYEYDLTVEMTKELAVVENNEKGREIRKYLIRLEEAWNSPEMVVQRASQLVGDAIKHYALAINKFRGTAEKLAKDKNLALAIKPLVNAADDLTSIMDPIVIKSETMQKKLGGLMRHYNLDREALDDIVFGIREKLGSKVFHELSEVYESGNRKLLSA